MSAAPEVFDGPLGRVLARSPRFVRFFPAPSHAPPVSLQLFTSSRSELLCWAAVAAPELLPAADLAAARGVSASTRWSLARILSRSRLPLSERLGFLSAAAPFDRFCCLSSPEVSLALAEEWISDAASRPGGLRGLESLLREAVYARPSLVGALDASVLGVAVFVPSVPFAPASLLEDALVTLSAASLRLPAVRTGLEALACAPSAPFELRARAFVARRGGQTVRKRLLEVASLIPVLEPDPAFPDAPLPLSMDEDSLSGLLVWAFGSFRSDEPCAFSDWDRCALSWLGSFDGFSDLLQQLERSHPQFSLLRSWVQDAPSFLRRSPSPGRAPVPVSECERLLFLPFWDRLCAAYALGVSLDPDGSLVRSGFVLHGWARVVVARGLSVLLGPEREAWDTFAVLAGDPSASLGASARAAALL